MSYIVFVSYSAKDVPDTKPLRDVLNLPNVRCFTSEHGSKPDAPLPPTVDRAIRACDLFILLWGRNAASSAWVRQEISVANDCKRPIVPFLLETGFAPASLIKELRSVPAYESPIQAMLTLRDAVVKNPALRKAPQSLFGAIALGGLLLFLLKSQ